MPHVLEDSVSGDEGVEWDCLSFLACLLTCALTGVMLNLGIAEY